ERGPPRLRARVKLGVTLPRRSTRSQVSVLSRGRLPPTSQARLTAWGEPLSSTPLRKDVTVTNHSETAILAGGCFWGMQDLIRKRPGVLSTRVGYTGGENANATYRNHPGHAEAIEIVFDPQQLSYRDLLEFFFQVHDPTTKNRQGNDVGTSYRSAIFYTT